MINLEIKDIVKVKETVNSNEANKMLEHGWILLSAGFIRDIEPGNECHSYSLGLPDGVPDKTDDMENNSVTKKKKYDYGF